MDEQPVDPSIQSDEELARRLQEEADREEQDALLAMEYLLTITPSFPSLYLIFFTIPGSNVNKKRNQSVFGAKFMSQIPLPAGRWGLHSAPPPLSILAAA